MLTPNSAIIGGSLITDRSASTIFTSHIPITIADAINSIRGRNESNGEPAFPMTVSLVEANESIPLVVRGVPVSAIGNFSALAPFQGAISRNSNWILLGSDAASELKARIGTLIILASPQTSGTLFNTTVIGIFHSGSESDYESFVSLPLGQELGHDAPGFASAIVVPSGIDFNTAATYDMTLNYVGYSGLLSIVDSSGYVHYSTTVGNTSDYNQIIHKQLSVTLPFGFYDVSLQQSGLRTSLAEFATLSNGTSINISSGSETSSPFVWVRDNSTQQPELQNAITHQKFSPLYYDAGSGSWIFHVGRGEYSLSIANTTTPLLIFANATFDADSNTQTSNSVLDVHVLFPQMAEGISYSFSTVPEGSYTITVEDYSSSQIVFAATTTNSSISVPVESGHSYLVTVLATANQLSLSENVTIPLQSGTSVLSLSIPITPLVPEVSPFSSYSSLGLGPPTQSAVFTGLEISAIFSALALFAIVFGLLGATIFAVGNQVIGSMKNELEALSFMFPTKMALFKHLKLPLLLISIGGSLLALFLSLELFYLFHMSLTITFSGYGLEVFPILYAVISLFALSVFSWARISIHIDHELTGRF